jgi:hypothetical protein
MDLKKTLSLCVALLLVVGFAGQASALDVINSTQQGVWIRTVAPSASGFAKIADTIRVNVLTLQNIVDTLFISVVTDTSATVGEARSIEATTGQDQGKNTSGTGKVVFSDMQVQDDAVTGTQDTFKVKFGIAPGDTSFQSATSLSVAVHANMSSAAATSYVKLTNLLTGFQILPGTSVLATTAVGDGKQFSVDGKRPTSGTVLDSVRIDTAGLAVGLAGTAATIKNGSKVIIRLHINVGGVIASGASSARVILVDTSQSINTASVIDSNLSYNRVFTDLFAGSVLRDTFTVAAGQFKNNLRIKPVAFLEDAAGNLSAATASASAPAGFTSGLVYYADSTVPVITPVRPHPDSTVKRISGALSNVLTNLRSDVNGGVSSPAFTANPLEFKVSENAKTVTAKFVKGSNTGTDTTLTLNAASFTAKTAVKSATTLNNTTPAGKTLDIVLATTDSVGNSATVTIKGVSYDEKTPSVTQQFPTQSKAPKNSGNSNKPTINAATRNPVIRVDEALDSLSVRYVQVGANPPDIAIQGISPGNAQLAKVNADIVATVNDSLVDGNQYTLQIVLVDKARNASVTAADTLTFTKNFNNPEADSFVVAVSSGASHGDSVIAGQQFLLKVTAIDTGLTNSEGANVSAVTYGGNSRIRANGVASVVFGGVGVTDNGDGTATLDTDGWVVGTRTVFFTSGKTAQDFDVVVENITTGTDGTVVVNFDGAKDSVSVDAAEMAKFWVQAWEGGEVTTAVSGEFSVSVTATDAWGNPSTKTRSIESGATIALTDSTGLLDSRINAKYVLDELLVELSTNEGDASVPSGPQALGAGTSTFTAIAPNRKGEGLWVGVRTLNANADSSGHAQSNAKHKTAQGSTGALAFVPKGVALPDPDDGDGDPGAPAAPANLIVQDYRGADGDGDHGGFILVSFPNSANHDDVGVYRIYREIKVTTGLDDEGNLVEGDAVDTWVPWTALDAVPGVDVQRAVVPTLGNAPTKWAVAAERGGATSDATPTAAKRVFTKESVQQIVQLLGVEATSVLSHTELVKQFTAPQDYVKSILGEQKNLRFAALDPDVTSLLGGSAVPQSIRTDGHVRVSSARTAIEEAVASVDNIAPAAVSEAAGAPSETNDAVSLSWTASADDKIVAFSTYRGYSIPIAGVDHYEVLRGTSEEDLTSLAILPAGANEFVDTDLPADATSLIYRVDALDLDNLTMGSPVTVDLITENVRRVFVASDGLPVYIIKLDGDLIQNFEDFIAFAQTYNLSIGDAGFNLQADIDDNGVVEFADFIRFASRYNSEANGPASKTAIAPARPGMNDNAEFSLSLGSDRVLAGEMITVDVTVANAQALLGYGMVVSYDTDKFEFVTATPAENDLLKSGGGDTPLFHHWPKSGEVTVANAVVNGSAVSGEGKIVSLTFKVLREFEDNARFEIGQGVVFDPDQLQNQVLTQGALTVESTPTEFALLQNFPNPFNPETTIGYNLAEGGDVSLRIYNIVGQVVRTLVSERQSSGRYQVRWSGTDDRGVAVSSGIYFYQVSAAGKFQDVKRLMLLK